MPLIEDLLLRFRRIWSPPGGVVGQAGVPEEAGAKLDEEIRDVSAGLAEIDSEADALVAAAQREAAAAVDAAAAEAGRVVEAARVRLPAIRAEAATSRARDRQAEIDQVIAGGESTAAAIRERAQRNIPALATRIAERLITSATPEEAHARVVGGR